MRRLAAMGALTLLAFLGAVSPPVAHADEPLPPQDLSPITNPIVGSFATSTTQQSKRYAQKLGTGLTGTPFSISIQTYNADTVAHNWQPEAYIYEYTNSDYTGFVRACAAYENVVSVPAGATSTVTMSKSSPIYYDCDTVVFDPTHYYVLVNWAAQNGTENGITAVGPTTPYSGGDMCIVNGGNPSLNCVEPDPTLQSIYFSIGRVPLLVGGPPAVLFLPGIEGSRLYRPGPNGEDKLWEPDFFSGDVPNMYMDQSGHSFKQDIYAKVGDVIDSIPTQGNVYGHLLQDFETLKQQGKISDWEAISYDWRLSLDDILSSGHEIDGKIYYDGPQAATSTPYIIQELRRLASGNHKVVIVSHSNGGLLAKRLTQILGETESSKLLSKIIFVASPQAGTPQAIAAAMHGNDQSLAGGLLLTSQQARAFGSTTPMLYNLLPSSAYFTQVDDPVVTFDPGLTEWISKYGQSIHSQGQMDAFLTDSYGRVDAETGDIDQPIQLDQGNVLITQANQMHSTLDTWASPAGVQVIQIAGWGIPSTIAGINYVKKGSGVEPVVNTTIDGDGTVPVPSALWTSGDATQNYWLDLKDFNSDHWLTTGLGYSNRKHGTIFDIQSLRSFVGGLASGELQSSYDYVSSSRPASEERQLRYSLRSPLTLDLYDDQGRHTGISPVTGELEEGIPDAYYLKVGDVKTVITDADSPIRISLKGYAVGSFTLKVEEVEGNTVIASTTFKDIPTTPDTTAELRVVTDITTLSPLSVDVNGDGNSELVLVPKPNDVVTIPHDETPPQTEVSVLGTSGLNGWYTSGVTVTLTGTDSESGIAHTWYSLNNSPFAVYSAPISVSREGTSTLQFFSIDTAGNREATSTLPIKIDTSAPEALVKLDDLSRAFTVTGVDEQSGTSSTQVISPAGKSSAVTDMAGHILTLNYSKNDQRTDRAALTISGLSYDSGVVSPTVGAVRYYWLALPRTTKPSLFIAHLKTKDAAVVALYSTSSNKTVIFSSPATDDVADLATLAATLLLKPRTSVKQYSGLAIPSIQTNKGKLNISY